MSFLAGYIQKSKHYKQRKNSLPGKKIVICNDLDTPFSNIPQKRISSRLSAAATVEAVLIFPLIIFFILSVVRMFELFYIHSSIGAELNNIGREMVAVSYPYRYITDGKLETGDITDSVVSGIWSEMYVKGRLNKLPASEKIASMTTLLSDFGEKDDIDIVVTYYVEPIIKLPGIRSVILTNHFYSKAYTGYAGSDTESEEKVFVTRTGKVYHTSLSCQGLKTTIEAVGHSEIDDLRNEDGSKYYPCEKCDPSETEGIVYITPYGNRYHSSDRCSELKIDIFEIPLSEVGDRHKCKYCMGVDH